MLEDSSADAADDFLGTSGRRFCLAFHPAVIHVLRPLVRTISISRLILGVFFRVYLLHTYKGTVSTWKADVALMTCTLHATKEKKSITTSFVYLFGAL